MSSANNTTLENLTGNSTDQQPSVSFVALLGVLLVTGTMANGYVFAALLKKSRRSPFDVTIVNLAMVDTLILLFVIPMCIVTLTFPDIAMSLCSVAGVLGQLLATYSLQVQCLILYANVRMVTAVSPNNKAAVGLVHLTLISVACLAVDSCMVVYPSVKHGFLRKLSSVGYCILTIKDSILWSRLMLIFYAIHLSGSVLMCTIFYIVLIRFIRKNSARSALARQRHVQIFKMVFRKVLLWVLAYSFITVARIVGYKNRWPEVTFQVSYFLLWSNSVLNPLCYIFTSPQRRKIFPRWLATSDQRNTDSTQQNAQQSSVTVNRRTNTTQLVTGIQESEISTLPWHHKQIENKLLSVPLVRRSTNTTQFANAAEQGNTTNKHNKSGWHL